MNKSTVADFPWDDHTRVDKYRFVRCSLKAGYVVELGELTDITEFSIKQDKNTALFESASISHKGEWEFGTVDDLIRVKMTSEAGDTYCEQTIATLRIDDSKDPINETEQGSSSATGLLYFADAKRLQSAYGIKAGTNLIAVVKALLVACGLGFVHSYDASGLTATKNTSVDAGTTYLETINLLLDACQYSHAYTNEYGLVVIEPLTAEKEARQAYDLASIATKVVLADRTKETDYYDVPNVYIVQYEGERATYTGVAKNKRYNSLLSTTTRGYELAKSEKVSDIGVAEDASPLKIKIALDGIAKDRLKETSVATEKWSLGSTFVPIRAGRRILAPAKSENAVELKTTALTITLVPGTPLDISAERSLQV